MEKKEESPSFVYNDELIKAVSYLRFKFRMSLRIIERFFEYYAKVKSSEIASLHLQMP